MKTPKGDSKPQDQPTDGHTQKRDKLATMKLFEEAALEIIKNEGIDKLKINELERKVGKSKRLMYAYYGSLDGLLQKVLESHDPWLGYAKNLASILDLHKENMGEELAGILLKNHLVSFYHDRFAQQVSLMELSKKGDLVLKSLTRSREDLGDRLFAIAEKHFEGSDVDMRAVMAILIGGINYLTLHKKANGSSFCGTDIAHAEDFREALPQPRADRPMGLPTRSCHNANTGRSTSLKRMSNGPGNPVQKKHKNRLHWVNVRYPENSGSPGS